MAKQDLLNKAKEAWNDLPSDSFHAVFIVNEKSFEGIGETAIDALRAIDFKDVGMIKTRGILQVYRNGKVWNRSFVVQVVRRFINNDVTRQIWAKQIGIAL